jgi:hypothetical protein
VDSKGKRLKNRKGENVTFLTGFPETTEEGGCFHHDESQPAFEYQPAQLPPGRLTFRTTVSVNDCWPLPIEVVVREE